MRVTVCELPHEPDALAHAWAALCEHAVAQRSELVLLPELAMVEPVWVSDRFDAGRWSAVTALSDWWLRRLSELRARYVVGTRPVRLERRGLNEAYLWSPGGGVQPLRSKYYLPQEPNNWEATWFERGDSEFPVFQAGPVAFGVNICTELWAVETYATYAAGGVELVLSPRATEPATMSKWLAAGVVAAVRSGAFSLSSNRVDPTGVCGGGGWIIDPAGEVLAVTSTTEPFATRDVDLTAAAKAKSSYPRYVFAEPQRQGRRPHGRSAVTPGEWP
jgi:N-carbamoylputrescine amidase